MPRGATYIFTTPDTPRALPGQEILRRFNLYLSGGGQVSGDALLAASVPEAVKLALSLATPDTIIYIGGSTFVVADALPLFNLTLV
jgi:dihydrofolate synthase/folylpolyglutamate synthase